MERTRWTDERIDESFSLLRSELGAIRSELRSDFRALDGKIDGLRRDVFAAMVAIVVYVTGIIVTAGLV